MKEQCKAACPKGLPAPEDGDHHEDSDQKGQVDPAAVDGELLIETVLASEDVDQLQGEGLEEEGCNQTDHEGEDDLEHLHHDLR